MISAVNASDGWLFDELLGGREGGGVGEGGGVSGRGWAAIR